MDEMNLRKVIAENLTYYRREKGLTQAALAATLNYSDKSVSKWERGEGLPDVQVLMLVAEYYGVTLNDLVLPRDARPTEEKPAETAETADVPEETTAKKPKYSLRTRILVPILSIGLVWLATMFAYFLVKVINPAFSAGELLFLYAIPASCIVATVFACLWWNQLLRFVFVSGIIWSVALCLFATFAVPYIGLIFAVAGVLQALTILWFIQIKK